MSTAKRLAALELAAEQAKAARIEANEALQRRVIDALSGDTLSALGDWLRTAHSDPAEAMRIGRSVAPIARPLEHPAREAALAWWDTVESLPNDGLYPLAPVGTADYLNAEAADWERAQGEEASGCPDMCRAAGWEAGRFRYYALLAREVGEVAG